MKIYTKTGDDGSTQLFGGARLPKHHLRIESYGTVDELNSQVGLLRDHLQEPSLRAALEAIQNQLFVVGAMLATDPNAKNAKPPHIGERHIVLLEQQIDEMTEQLPPLRHFILPGGGVPVSLCHVARCVCRRAERCVVALAESEPVSPLVVRYLNRLSDYFFVLARYVAHISGAEEVIWKKEDEADA
ncbi:MAG: cob(I)yrinic acid a,c-diamide adenosyltransferase [Sphingobacteriales bacterium]|nr:cob(I)yrinic acid a,c-diamide adenosyltransferase [Sphingobacteriales bacterium]